MIVVEHDYLQPRIV